MTRFQREMLASTRARQLYPDGRLVRRRVFASTKAAALEALSAWPGLRTVLAVETIRSVNSTDKGESEIRYFLSSGADDPATLGAAIRTHWSIENALHWVLDVTFRVRTTAACVIAGPRAISHSCVRSRSTLLAVTGQPRPACAPSGKRPPGTTITCSNSWPEARRLWQSRSDFHALPLLRRIGGRR